MSTNTLPISRKALNGFLQRIRHVYTLDPEKTSAMEHALHLYLDNDNSYRLAIPDTDRTAFEFLRHEIDTAIERSRRARERARLRREAKASLDTVSPDTSENIPAETPSNPTAISPANKPEPTPAEVLANGTTIPVITPDRFRADSDNCIVIDSDETDPTYAGPVEVRIDPTGCQPLSYSIKYPAPATSSGTRSQRRAEERKAKKDLLAAMRRLRNGIKP